MNTLLHPMLAVSLTGAGGIGPALCLLVVAIIVLAFLVWVNNGYVPEPLRKYGLLVIVLIGVLMLINFVLSFSGHAFINW